MKACVIDATGRKHCGRLVRPARSNPPVRPVREDKMHELGMEPVPGGVYIHPVTREVLNGFVYAGGFIDANVPRVRFQVSDERAEYPRAQRGAKQTKVNLFRGGWRWQWVQGGRETSLVEGAPVIVSVERGGQHFYALRVVFETPVRLATYPKAEQPQLRPTALVTTLEALDVVGVVRLASGREHAVYGSIVLR